MGKSFSIYALLFFAISVRSQPNPLDLLVSRLFKDYNNFASPYANRRSSFNLIFSLYALFRLDEPRGSFDQLVACGYRQCGKAIF